MGKEPDVSEPIRRLHGPQRAVVRMVIGVAALIGVFLIGSALRDGGEGGTAGSPTTERAQLLQIRPVEDIVTPGRQGSPSIEPPCDGAPGSCAGVVVPVDQEVVLEDRDGVRYRLGKAVITGDDVTGARAAKIGPVTIGAPAEWAVQFQLDEEATAAFSEATASGVVLPPPQNQLAMVVQGVVVSAPTIQAPIDTGAGIITAGFTRHDARLLAMQLQPF